MLRYFDIETSFSSELEEIFVKKKASVNINLLSFILKILNRMLNIMEILYADGTFNLNFEQFADYEVLDHFRGVL